MEEMTVICTLCPLHKLQSAPEHNCIQGIGNTNARYVFVLDGPQTKGQEPASGRDRKKFFELLAEAGISTGDVFITYAWRCWPGIKLGKLNNVGSTVWRKCAKWLNEELDHINPEIVFPMGANATKAVLNDNNIKFEELRGSFIQRLHKVFPIYNLRQLYYDPSIKPTLVADLKRATNPTVLVGNDWGQGIEIAPSAERLEELFNEALRVGYVASDVETKGEWYEDNFKITHYGAYWGDNRGMVFDPRNMPEFYQRCVTNLYQRVHYSPYEGNIYPNRSKIEHDSYCLMYLTDPNLAQRSLGLEPLSRQFLGVETWKGQESNWESWAKRNAFDVRCTWELTDYALAQLNPQQLRLYREIILPSAMILGGLKARKIIIDKAHQKRMHKKIKNRMYELKEDLELCYSFFGNPNSSQQSAEFLYHKRKIPKIKRYINGKLEELDGTGAEILCQLALDHPEADLIRAYRKLKKVESNYIYDEDFIRPSIRPCGTVSGRAAGDDGIQTFARPNEKYLPDIVVKDSYLAERGMWVGGDLCQIELVLAAIKSGDPTMLRIYSSEPPGDIHVETALTIFESADKESRNKAKPINFLEIYKGKAGVFRLTALKEYGLNFTYQESHYFCNKFFQKYVGLADWHLEVARTAVRQGYVDSPLGQRYPIPGIFSTDEKTVEAAIRYAINWPNQGDGHYLNMLGVIASYELDPLAPVLPVHDSLGNSLAPEDAEEFSVEWKRLWQKKIDEYYPLEERKGIPIRMDVKIGRTLGEV